MSDRGKIQTIPTTMVTGYWDKGSVSEIPEEVKIVMANGKRAIYRLHIEQPRPQVRESIRLIRTMNNIIYGENEKTGDAATSTGQRTKNTVVSIPQKGKLNNEGSL